MYYSLGYLPSTRKWYVLRVGSGFTPSINDIMEGTSKEGYSNHEDAYISAERTGNRFMSEYDIISFKDSQEVKLSELIPKNTNLTFLIRVLELRLYQISAEEAAQIIGEGILDIENGNFKVVDISPYFDCHSHSDMIIKLDITTQAPFLPEQLVSMFTSKLKEVTKISKGLISNLYCPPIIRILKR